MRSWSASRSGRRLEGTPRRFTVTKQHASLSARSAARPNAYATTGSRSGAPVPRSPPAATVAAVGIADRKSRRSIVTLGSIRNSMESAEPMCAAPTYWPAQAPEPAPRALCDLRESARAELSDVCRRSVRTPANGTLGLDFLIQPRPHAPGCSGPTSVSPRSAGAPRGRTCRRPGRGEVAVVVFLKQRHELRAPDPLQPGG